MRRFLCLFLLIVMLFSMVSCVFDRDDETTTTETTKETEEPSYTTSTVPAYSGDPYIVINKNQPTFSTAELSTTSFVSYGSLDELKRCGVAFACIGKDLTPTEKQSSNSVKPTGWYAVKYDSVEGKYLYNRCQLIGYELSGDNASTKNIITGTRYMIVKGIDTFENQIFDYVQDTDNHVMYRVTPIFDGDNLLARGVQLEAYSVEDNGEGICFNVYCYNVQPGIVIDYATGESSSKETSEQEEETTDAEYWSYTYILNTSTKKVHSPTCRYAISTATANKKGSNASSEDLLEKGYTPCGLCKPFEQTTEETTTSESAQ